MFKFEDFVFLLIFLFILSWYETVRYGLIGDDEYQDDVFWDNIKRAFIKKIVWFKLKALEKIDDR